MRNKPTLHTPKTYSPGIISVKNLAPAMIQKPNLILDLVEDNEERGNLFWKTRAFLSFQISQATSKASEAKDFP